ncbi:MAG: STAS domain-containing protein [Methylococcaceae bacterium]|nr:STAS domain-containing protein [Methylococcaceae bacterium]MCI0734320.1 STAS domain-containing protein [Methylococcaceae bacterium]
MEITTRHVFEILVVDIAGRLDSLTVGYVNDEMGRIVQSDPTKILVNLEKLDFISSAGLRVLLVAAKLQQSYGGQFKICNANPSVRSVLESSGFNSLISLYPSESEAIGSF